MTHAQLIAELEEIKKSLNKPEHFSPLQLRAWRRRRAVLNRQLTKTIAIIKATNYHQQPLFR